ncbi:MFS transporter [Galactobacter sp.]|uniref:MFS transporter n=1 Tax=Galactobacter sp. TaxID=2676125 RepID=UPI0025C46F61|nr:MFS transporter [Galactobacter sp.]
MSTTDSPAPGSQTTRMPKAAKRAVWAGFFGTLIEWYDYALYGAAAGLIIGPLFFPDVIPASAALLSFATFAVGFVVRPLGGLVISHLGDRVGRKPAMILTVVLMGVATVGMGALPTAASIGLAAPILLVVFRFIQGFGAGAELAGALTLVSEYTDHKRRGLYVGLVTCGAPGGAFLATLSFTFVSMLPGDVLLEWAWRIPFLVSALLFFLALWIRRHLEETPEYRDVVVASRERDETQRVPLAELFRHSPRELVAGFFSVAGHNVTNYVLSTFCLSYLTLTVGMPRMQALTAVLISSGLGAMAPTLGGLVVDRIGAKKLLIFGCFVGIVMTYPLFLALQSGNVVWATSAMTLMTVVGVGSTAASTGTYLTNLFPTRYRFTGVAAARELNGAIVAGPTPLIATALISAANGGIGLVVAFVILACLASLAAVLFGTKTLGDRQPEEVAA